jgi:NAD(P)-dependent dehydrogenase (short-subunit alcohol dehydrogenase family)
MRALAVEHGADGIRSNLIAPGYVDTQFGTRGPEPHEKDLDQLLAMLSTNPRTASPEEIADVAVFLASDSARSMNGSVVVADGGWTAL